MPHGNKSIIKGNVVFLGDQQSGKTSLINQILKLPFTTDYACTVGMEYRYLPLDSSEQNTKQQIAIWDSTGMLRHRRIVEGTMNALSKRSLIDIVIIAIAANQSYQDKIDQFEYWRKFVPPSAKLIVLETKNDKQGNYLPYNIDSIKNGANKISYFSTSAKTKSNIDAVSNEIIKAIQEKRLEQESSKIKQNNITQSRSSQFSSLCCCLPFFSPQTNFTTNEPILKNVNNLNATQLKSVLLKLREKLKTGALNNIDKPYEVSIFCNQYYNYQDTNGIKRRINVPKNVFDALMSIQISLQLLNDENNIMTAKQNLNNMMINFENAVQSFSLTRSNSTKHFYAQLPEFLNTTITQSTAITESKPINSTTASTKPIAVM